jgi:hypothetical protein
LELIGATEESVLRDSGFHHLPEGLVVVQPTVSYQESLSLMAASDGLLVIDAPMQRSVFLPSKLIDYVGAARPILGITPPGTSANLISQLGGWLAEPSEIKSIAQVLAEFLTSLRLSRTRGVALWGNAVVRNRYEAPIVGANFRNMLAELINQS